MRKVALFSAIFSSLSGAPQIEEKALNTNLEQFGYVNGGLGPAPFPLPTLGGGYRMHIGQQGLDLNASFIIVAPERSGVKFASRYLYYFSSNFHSPQWYIGLGPQVSSVFNIDRIKWSGLGASPEVLFGREHFSNRGKKRYWEVAMDFLTVATNTDKVYKFDSSEKVLYFPYVFLNWGWGF